MFILIKLNWIPSLNCQYTNGVLVLVFIKYIKEGTTAVLDVICCKFLF